MSIITNRGSEGFANKIAQKMESDAQKVSKRKGEDILELGAEI